MGAPDGDIAPLLTDPTRLRTTALLSAAEHVDVPFVATRVGLSDSALSKQAATLREAGYLTITKKHCAQPRAQSYGLTEHGREQLRIAALQVIAVRPENASADRKHHSG